MDLSRKLVDANPAMVRIFGYEDTEYALAEFQAKNHWHVVDQRQFFSQLSENPARRASGRISFLAKPFTTRQLAAPLEAP